MICRKKPSHNKIVSKAVRTSQIHSQKKDSTSLQKLAKIQPFHLILPTIKPDSIRFKEICLEKVVNLFNRFRFTPSKHLSVIETCRFFFTKHFNFQKTFHLTKTKKLKFLKINRK
jgi:hypothetical protein